MLSNCIQRVLRGCYQNKLLRQKTKTLDPDGGAAPLTRHLGSYQHNWQRHTHTHIHTHHGVESFLQLLLLQEQTAGHAFPLTVAASRGEQTCQQHQQVPQRDLHSSAQPDREGWQAGGPAGQGEESYKTRVDSLRNREVKPDRKWAQSAGRMQIEQSEHCVNREGSLTGFGRSVKALVLGDDHEMENMCGMESEREHNLRQ